MTANITKLCEKAMLVKLTIRRAALTKRDNFLTAKLQAQEQDRGLTVLTKLFKSKDSPINVIMTRYGEVYAYHKQHTLPYMDAGPRVLPNGLYFDYTQEMKKRIAAVDSMLAQYLPQYDSLVLDDVIARNGSNIAGRASPDDYPTAEEFERSMSVELRFQPMPDVRHFLFDLSDDDLAACERAEAEAAALANADTVNRMLKPLHTLVTRLGEYQGLKGERFHNSIVENVIDGCALARKLALQPTPELLAEITNLEDAAKGYLANVEVIKGSANARDEAKRKLQEVAAKMAVYA
jgi:hypothetical protein